MLYVVYTVAHALIPIFSVSLKILSSLLIWSSSFLSQPEVLRILGIKIDLVPAKLQPLNLKDGRRIRIKQESNSNAWSTGAKLQSCYENDPSFTFLRRETNITFRVQLRFRFATKAMNDIEMKRPRYFTTSFQNHSTFLHFARKAFKTG